MQGNYKSGYNGTDTLFKSWQSLAMSSLYHNKRVSFADVFCMGAVE